MGNSYSFISSKDKTWLEVARSASVLLSNRAETHLRLGNLGDAVVDAAAATLLDKTYKKAAFKLVKAYSQWQQTRSCNDSTSQLTASALASAIGRTWPSFHRSSLFRSLKYDKKSEPCDLWWEESDFTQVLYRMKPVLPASECHVNTWKDVKSEANKNFSSKHFELALNGYSRALQMLDNCHWFSKSLIKFSAKYWEGSPHTSVALTNVAIILTPWDVSAWSNRAVLMQHLGRYDDVIDCLKIARGLIGSTDSKILDTFEVLENLAKKSKAQKVEGDFGKDLSSKFFASEKITLPESLKLSAQDLAMLNGRTNSIKWTPSMVEKLWLSLPEEEHIRMFGTKMEAMPDFCAEYLEQSGGKFPAGVNPRIGKKYLSAAYQHIRCLPFRLESLYRNSERGPPPEDELIWRLGCSRKYEPALR